LKQFFIYFKSWVDRWVFKKTLDIHKDAKRFVLFGAEYCKKEIVPLLSKMLSLSQKKIIDVGCGYGGVVYALSDKNYVVGIDTDQSRIESAKEICIGKNASFIKTNAEKLPFVSEYIDIVIINDIVEHIKDVKSVMKEVERILKKNCIAYVSFTPYYGPRGGHIWNYFPFLYIHFLLPNYIITWVIKKMGDIGPLATAEYDVSQYKALNKLRINTFRKIVRDLKFQIEFEKTDSIFFNGIKKGTDLFAMEYTAILRKKVSG